MEKNIETVQCFECNKHFRTINRNHLKKHKITTQQYKEKYNNPKMTAADISGENNPTKRPENRKKISDALLKAWARDKEGFLAKQKKTVMEHFGVEDISKSDVIKERRKKTNLERYGVEYISQVKETRDKVKRTNLERFGYISNLNDPKIKAKSKSLEARKKEYETKKKNGSLQTSKLEKQFYEVLCEFFNKKDVEYGVFVNKWEIDFYVKSINTYIQFDGKYWHGLIVDVSEIKKSKNERDKAIYKSYMKDREQDVWFADNCMRLIRVTDEEFNTLDVEEIRDKILNG